MREPGWEHVADLLAFAQEAPRQILRFHHRKRALAAAACEETLGATGCVRELGPRVPNFGGRDLRLHAVGETLGSKPRLELGDSRTQNLQFSLEGDLFTLDKRLAGGHNLSRLDQQGAHEASPFPHAPQHSPAARLRLRSSCRAEPELRTSRSTRPG